MPIRFHCSACHKRLTIARRKAGTLVVCPLCQTELVVPHEFQATDWSKAEGNVAICDQPIMPAASEPPRLGRPVLRPPHRPRTGAHTPPPPTRNGSMVWFPAPGADAFPSYRQGFFRGIFVTAALFAMIVSTAGMLLAVCRSDQVTQVQATAAQATAGTPAIDLDEPPYIIPETDFPPLSTSVSVSP